MLYKNIFYVFVLEKSYKKTAKACVIILPGGNMSLINTSDKNNNR